MDQTANIRSFFDAEALEYVRERERQYSFAMQKEIVLGMLPRRRARVLDIGCGPAIMEETLLDYGAEVWGIDASAQMVAYGQARLKSHPRSSRFQLAVGDTQQLEFADGYFDSVLSMGVLEYVQPYDRALSEIHRVLRPGGVAVLTLPSRVALYHLAREAAESMRGVAKILLGRAPSPSRRFVTNRCVPWRLDRQLEHMGFRKVEGRYCNFILYPLHELHPQASLKLNRALSGLSGSRFGAWLGTQYVVKAEKL